MVLTLRFSDNPSRKTDATRHPQESEEHVMPSSCPRTLVSLVIAVFASALMVGGATSQETGMSVTVELQEFDDSGISGTAVLTETAAAGTHVSMRLVGAELDGNHPTHIHTGTCDNFDPSPLYPLETVNLSPVNEEGVSETTVEDVDVAELHDGEYVILVHQSPEELTNYLVCGEIGGGTLGTSDLGASESQPPAQHMPTAGVGPGIPNQFSGLGVAFFALACLSAMAAIVARKSAR